MPKLSRSVPKYRKHRASGQAIVTLNGRDFYLGPHGSRVTGSISTASSRQSDILKAKTQLADAGIL